MTSRFRIGSAPGEPDLARVILDSTEDKPVDLLTRTHGTSINERGSEIKMESDDDLDSTVHLLPQIEVCVPCSDLISCTWSKIYFELCYNI